MGRRPTIAHCLLATFCIAAILSGCGGSGSGGGESSGVSAPRELAPLTLTEVGKIPQNDPAGTIMQLWFWGQWGSSPNVVASYDPRTVQVAGSVNIARVFVSQRSTLLQYRPRVVDKSIRGSTAFVSVEGRADKQKPFRISFALRRVGRVWLITHDTLLDGTLPDIVAGREDPDPLRTKHPARYVKRGQAVTDQVREQAGRVASREVQAKLQPTEP